MSHYRNLGGGRRDANEPQISKRFTAHGWHAEQVSGNRQWDLNVYPPKPTMTGTNNQCLTLVCHVDVKGPKGKVEEAQAEKWTALHAKGIPVYVVRTAADVDALVAGTLEPWRPAPHGGYGTKQSKRGLTSRKGDAAKAREEGARCQRCFAHVSEPCRCSSGRKGYTPPRSTPPDAAKRVPGLGAATMIEMLKPPGEENYEAALRRALDAAKEAEVFAPPAKRLPCLDPDKMNGAGDQFPGSDYD